MHTDVRDVRGHPFNGAAPPDFQKALVAHRVELQQRRTVLKSLRPLRPAARGVFPFHGKHGRALLRLPPFLEAEDFLPRQLEQPIDFRQQRVRRQPVVNFDGHGCWLNGLNELNEPNELNRSGSPTRPMAVTNYSFNDSASYRFNSPSLTVFADEIRRPR